MTDFGGALGAGRKLARRPARYGALVLSALLSCLAVPLDGFAQSANARNGRVETDVRSEYSRIRIRRLESTRALIFIRDNGDEVIESMIDLSQPHELLIEYTQFMFVSYIHRPEQRKVLIVGLGGGAMVQFLKKYDPEVEVHVVEIDKEIINIAEKYFKTRSEGKVKIIQADAFKYLAETEERYDVIYMDAFLKPSRDTDPNGVPLALKTARFYKQVQDKLTTDGLVVFNLNPHSGSRNDIAGISKSFNNAYVYTLPSGGFVVAASIASTKDVPTAIMRQAKMADKRFGASFSFERMTYQLQR